MLITLETGCGFPPIINVAVIRICFDVLRWLLHHIIVFLISLLCKRTDILWPAINIKVLSDHLLSVLHNGSSMPVVFCVYNLMFAFCSFRSTFSIFLAECSYSKFESHESSSSFFFFLDTGDRCFYKTLSVHIKSWCVTSYVENLRQPFIYAAQYGRSTSYCSVEFALFRVS